YPQPTAILPNLNAIGATNAAASRTRGLMGRGRWRRAMAALDAMRRDGRIPATFEVVHGHAWKAAPNRTADGRAIVRVQRTASR
ncbi:MAG: malonyl-[acyl-carrier protein] O-methyltransferase BioC, partial [Candidatus Levyibacteriota bacterium]